MRVRMTGIISIEKHSLSILQGVWALGDSTEAHQAATDHTQRRFKYTCNRPWVIGGPKQCFHGCFTIDSDAPPVSETNIFLAIARKRFKAGNNFEIIGDGANEFGNFSMKGKVRGHRLIMYRTYL